ncbi:hypothetical protein AB5J52_00130 [Streptomyces sp. R39]|uniref:DUF4365 domain-containing protein n=1 Tax=Streptomyces sp. R39 TaxID=3238631 RepID=A0AB39QDU9_9ACTN
MTAPLRPGSPTDPDELPVYVQPVDDTGMPLARPRPADYSFDHLLLRERFALLAAGELAHRHVAEPIAWNGPDLTAWDLSGLTVVVQFKSGWGSTSPTGSPDHRLLPSAGAMRDTSALALWTYVSPLAADRSGRELQLPLTAADLWDPDQWAGLHRARRAVTLLGARGADAWLGALGRNPEQLVTSDRARSRALGPPHSPTPPMTSTDSLRLIHPAIKNPSTITTFRTITELALQRAL